jgi:beta-glucanase (GH16 family)
VESDARAPVSPTGHAVSLVDFHPAVGTVAPGDAAVSSLRVRNGGERAARVWVGYSVRDAAGAWHDVPSVVVDVDAGETSVPAALRWRVPPSAAAGPARVVMALWDAPPEGDAATRLDSADRPDALVVAPGGDDAPGWAAGAHRLGRGLLRPGNVRADGDATRLVLPAGGFDGAQVASAVRYGEGSFVARMRTARAPGSLSALFLYEDVPGDANDEVDVEVFNDGSGRVLLSTWRDGQLTRSEERELGFDPSAAEHEYRIDWRPGEVRFLVDGRLLRAWYDGVPHRPMKLMANAWWPTWLPGAAPEAEAATVVRGLAALPFPAQAPVPR